MLLLGLNCCIYSLLSGCLLSPENTTDFNPLESRVNGVSPILLQRHCEWTPTSCAHAARSQQDKQLGGVRGGWTSKALGLAEVSLS